MSHCEKRRRLWRHNVFDWSSQTKQGERNQGEKGLWVFFDDENNMQVLSRKIWSEIWHLNKRKEMKKSQKAVLSGECCRQGQWYPKYFNVIDNLETWDNKRKPLTLPIYSTFLKYTFIFILYTLFSLVQCRDWTLSTEL